MALIEGVGDEIVYLLLTALIVVLISASWWSTQVRPLWQAGSVWLVQMQTWPHQRVLQVVEMDGNTAATTTAAAGRTEGEETAHTVRVTSSAGDGSDDDEVIVTPIAAASSSSSPAPQLSDASAAVPVGQTMGVRHEQIQTSPLEVECSGRTSSQQVGPDAQIRLKYLDDTQRLVSAWLTQSVGDFKKKHFASEVASGQVIRLIYRGHLLRDDSRSLASYGLHDRCIVHCHVSSTPYASSTSQGPQQQSTDGVRLGGSPADGALDMGRYMHVVFVAKFAGVWAFFCLYPHYFDFASFFSLLLCTLFYLAFVYSSARRRMRNRRREQQTADGRLG